MKIAFSPYFCLSTGISLNILCMLFKLGILILHRVMEGIMSQIFYLGPSFCFM